MGEENEGQDLATDMKKDEELLEKIKRLEEKAKEERQHDDISVKYYEDANLQIGKNVLKVSIAEITEKFLNEQGKEENTTTYDVYMKFDGQDVLIANIDETGTLKVNKDVVQKIDPDNKLGLLELGDQEKPDLSVLKDMEGKTRDELEQEKAEKDRDEKEPDKDEEKDKDEQLDEDIEKESEDEQTKEIAQMKNIPEKNVYRIRKDSQFFKNYPMVDKSTYFYRDNDGKMKAEYIDKDGKVQPSPYFQDSTTQLMDMSISVGTDGQDVKKQIPYQVMRTNHLQRPGIRDVRISVYFENGYINMEETRLGDDGKWVGYGIEKQGRDYNSHKVNDISSTTRKKDKSELISKSYERIENSGFEENGITLEELNPRETLERLMDEGYDKKHAIGIINYMIGPENLSEDKAKERVNDEIIEEQQREERNDDDDGAKTPWDNAMSRRGM